MDVHWFSRGGKTDEKMEDKPGEIHSDMNHVNRHAEVFLEFTLPWMRYLLLCNGDQDCNKKSLSSCESELYAAIETYEELNFVRILVWELSHLKCFPGEDKVQLPSILMKLDNESTQKVLENGSMSARLKHVEVRKLFLVQKVKDGELNLEHVASKRTRRMFLRSLLVVLN
eukprot:TRINITY_DN80652_c0_g1_i1.p1 TRINITY_DN80652_c0_g1~~TRINITY_DN80652_c0_g1_i1.p1  ORF type:complete len:171 (+),score=23.88 TRINITY_DN80652_c0_g1_i1:255-767(+)